MNSSNYLSHIDGFNDEDPYTISLKYSLYTLAYSEYNGDPIASSFRYISNPIPN